MKQTAVEWLVKTLELDTRFNGIMNDVIEQAKEIEKEHKIEFADEYGDYLLNGGMMSANSYMETFKSE